MTSKAWKPSVNYDPRFKEYVDKLKIASGLDGAQIIRLALYVAAGNPTFVSKLRGVKDNFKMPMPPWGKDDDTMWLYRQGEIVEPIRRKPTIITANGQPPTDGPADVVIRIGEAAEVSS